MRKYTKGIDKLLWLAALDRDFRNRLLADRRSAIEGSGFELTAAEKRILLGASDDLMLNIVERTSVPEPARRAFLRGAAAGLVVFLGTCIAGPPSPIESCARASGVSAQELPEDAAVGVGGDGDAPGRREGRGDAGYERGARAAIAVPDAGAGEDEVGVVAVAAGV